VEDDDQVDVELNLEIGMLVGRARILGGEEHVKWDLKVGQHIAISHLYVLNLSRVSLTLERLYAH